MYNNNLDVSNDYLLDDYSSFISNENACSLNIPMLREAIFKSKTNNKNYFIIGDLLSRTKTNRNSGIYEETEFLKQQLGDSLIQKYIVRPTDTLKSVYDRLCPNSFTNQGVSLYDAYVNYVFPDLPPMNDDVLNKMIQKAKDSGQKVYFKRVSDYTLSDSNFRTESQNNNEIGLLRLYGLDVDSRAANPNDNILTLTNRLSGRTFGEVYIGDQVIESPQFPQLESAPQAALNDTRKQNILIGETLDTPIFTSQPQNQQPTFQPTFSEPIPVVRGGNVLSSGNEISSLEKTTEDKMNINPAILIVAGIVLLGGILYITKK